ncbi:membrane protein [Catellatospora sp. TT07R-123]|uniref:CPBP family intramembrane glutamic endopeptidase n=1 Tax=Catellatospora sp. TT07R-123 TaxID=2733863 RepID=UPI001B0A73FE|nr:CPBP family intramembrane glutamic endopeptidase [Catellatospora sp. TT07R-123]GHJ46535.1 membrane protein [Catellatospora sp. TT07R-123]
MAAEELDWGSPRPTRTLLGHEVLLLLGVSLGYSAIRSVLSLIDKLTVHVPLNQQAAELNTAVTPDRPWLDLSIQLTRIAFGVVPALFAVHLLNRGPGLGGRLGAPEILGYARRRVGFDLGGGALLAAAIGIPGLGLYLAAKALGVNATVVASGLGDVWWAVPVLVLAAVENAVLEEVVVVGYLLTRLRQLGWSTPAMIAASAVLRGSYHLYQGFGAFVGNAVMGVVFALVFLRWRRVGPLIVAHTLLDIVSFVGYALLAGHLSWL